MIENQAKDKLLQYAANDQIRNVIRERIIVVINSNIFNVDGYTIDEENSNTSSIKHD